MSPRIFAACAASIGFSIAASSATAAAFNYGNVSRVNVLRNYNASSAFQVSTATTTTDALISAGGGFVPSGAIDGGGWNVQTAGGTFTSSTDLVVQTFTLAQSVKVGSYWFTSLGGGNRPNGMLIEGLVGANWVTLANVNPTTGGTHSGTFSPQTVSALRYQASGAALGGNFFTLNELEVYLDSTAASPDLRGGYNLTRDPSLVTAGVTSNTGLHSAQGFYTPSGTAGSLIDGDPVSSNVNFQSPVASGNRAFVTYNLNIPVAIGHANIGGFHGQGWDGWAFWTNAVANPNPALDSDWILQFNDPVGGGIFSSTHFTLAQPGIYTRARFTWNVQSGAATNFELYAIPEPATALILAPLVGLLCGRRNRR